ncbi:MAG: MTH1187 family thiamine-binding protein [Thiovulaceae bacterium]|nr:MTH1187 family thiamine-binding protein [Sulfurimonadaceae bacterium]
MSVLLEFSMFPTDRGESKSEFVARVLDVIDTSGLNYQLTPMGTVVEGETIDEVLKLIGDCYKILEPDCNRVSSFLKFDIRKGKNDRLRTKVASVEEKLGREIKH